MITKNEFTPELKQKYIEEFKIMLEKSSGGTQMGIGKYTIHQVLIHVSSSGMCRWIQNYLIINGDIINIDDYIRMIVYETTIVWEGKHSGVKVGGCGMDMGFYLVRSLERSLGFKDYTIGHNWLS